MSKEKRFLVDFMPQGIELRNDGESRTIEGYAAVFNKLSRVLGWFREKIAPGAFDGVLDQDVVALFNHNDDHLLARTASKTLKLSVDENGLKYSFDAPNTTAGNDVLEMVRRGDLNGSSFAFSIEADEWTEDDDGMEIRTITKIRRLFDVSPVVSPAYLDTDVAARSFDGAQKSFDEYKKTKEKTEDKDNARRVLDAMARNLKLKEHSQNF